MSKIVSIKKIPSSSFLVMQKDSFTLAIKPEDHWSCIAHLNAEDLFKLVVIEEKKFKHSPWAGADNPFGPKF